MTRLMVLSIDLIVVGTGGRSQFKLFGSLVAQEESFGPARKLNLLLFGPGLPNGRMIALKKEGRRLRIIVAPVDVCGGA